MSVGLLAVSHNSGVTTAEPRKRRSPRGSSSTALVTYLGAIVRPLGNWFPIGGTVELMQLVGVDEAAVRTSVSRLKSRGWLVADERGGIRGYSLTSVALDVFAEGDEVIWHARKVASLSDGWCIISFSVPEQQRASRDGLRNRFNSVGFGTVGTATWIGPARMQPLAVRALSEFDLEQFASVFVGEYVGPRDLAEVVADAWDLEAINSRYRAFADRHSRTFESDAALSEPAELFKTYVSVLDEWRVLPFRDPVLPRELLPIDWSADSALAAIERVVTHAEKPARHFASTFWP